MKTKVVILAGGKGTRMLSDIPKSLHCISEKTMIKHILESVRPIDPHPVVVVGHKKEEVIAEGGEECFYVWQKEQLGTGHAVAVAKEKLLEEKADYILVVPGDAPLLTTHTLGSLLEDCINTKSVISLAVAVAPSFEKIFSGFEKGGRILRNKDGGVEGIIEWRDATEGERGIHEINAGFYCFRADFLWENITKIQNGNAAHEIYLTDLVALATKSGEGVSAVVLKNPIEGLGVNTQEELLSVENSFVKP
jgi:bifunctional UDP-N-acetylglucosamine pyrophosphorylase/glucosamine-1-phosphate N-acetyltransferase